MNKKTKQAATPAQKKVIGSMLFGDQLLFSQMLEGQKSPITAKTIDDVLEVEVNTLEGDTSQMSPELARYAKKKGWLRGYE